MSTSALRSHFSIACTQGITAFLCSNSSALSSLWLPTSSRPLVTSTAHSSDSSSSQPTPRSTSPSDAVPKPAVAAADGGQTAAAVARPPNRKQRRAALRQAVAEAGRQAARDPPEGRTRLQARLEARQRARQSGSVESVRAATAAPVDTAVPRVLEGKCRRKNVPLGWKKLDFVLRMIRRSYVDDAMAQLAVNPKKAAVFVMHAVANARNNAICAGADASKVWVSEAYVTKGQYQKRVAIMGRGFSGVKETRKSHLNVTVQQIDESDAAAAAAKLRRPARLIAPLNLRPQWSREESRPRLRLWSGRGLQQQQQLGLRM
eukprot:GHUV01016132.1.p1 GENE.GHUV01016132.1~~GHUV01016132.1.p1  ORF type:complete len:318 (+),score=85.66 GHUV01016132.1:280-1233(+)